MVIATFFGGRDMVLCFLNMGMDMTTLFFCNTDSMAGKVGISRGVLRVGDGPWDTLFPAMDVPCTSLWRFLARTKISEKL